VTGPVAEMFGVKVRAGGRTILDVPVLEVRRGEFLGVVGLNGAGKTTLVATMIGLTRPTEGRVRLLGQDLTTAGRWRAAAARRAVGYVSQSTEMNVALPLTVREVVETGRAGPAGLFRRYGRADQRLVADWLDRFELGPLAGRTFRSLSGGEKQKTLLARAMVAEPELLVLDEPAAGLDIDCKDRVVGLIEDLYLAGRLTVVMVTHETGALPSATRRVALMRDGRIAALGPPGETLRSDTLGSLYGARVRVVEMEGRRYAIGLGSKERP